ncbi:hypothetical protein RB195_018057 [Necator americanus]|uniref:Uncharacterized protein n=1 Tax=Necator americanus TaxID=51031 RepID=A0ABR1C800_NECAM
MDEMRFRLRQAIYTIALKKNSRSFHSASETLNDYEEWLVDQFIAQITRSVGNGSTMTSRDHREESSTSPRAVSHKFPVSSDNGLDPHRMTIALESFTTEPLNDNHRKLITIDDLRMMDLPAASSESRAVPLLFRLPLWQLILMTASSILFLFLISTILIVCLHERKKKAVFVRKPAFSLALQDNHHVPNANNASGSFRDRFNQLRGKERTVQERDNGEIWVQPSTTFNSVAALPRV